MITFLNEVSGNFMIVQSILKFVQGGVWTNVFQKPD
jgi:hypothetical protein